MIQTPLIELLERIPQDARLIVEHDQFSSSSHPVGRMCHEAAAALRAALAEPVQEQVAWRDAVESLVKGFEHVSGIARNWEPDHSSGADRAKWAQATEACADVVKLLRTAPPQRNPLTLSHIRMLWSQAHDDTTDRMAFEVLARSIEAAHGIKENT